MRYLAFFVTLLAASATYAAPKKSAPAAPASIDQQDLIVPYVGIFDVTDEEDSVQFGGEYRFHVWDYGVRPTLGVNVDTNGGAYVYGGINWEVPIDGARRWIIIPNFMVGAYHEGDSKDLGGALEFRSGIELDYQFENQHRVGVAFNHISNASIYDKNPGAETLLINYSVPVNGLR